MSSDATQEVVRKGIVKKLLKILKVEQPISGFSSWNRVFKAINSN